VRFALVDNGSLEPAAHLHLRRVAAAITNRAGLMVEPASWRHSDRIDPIELGGIPAATLGPWLRTRAEQGERDFLIIPFLVSPRGAIGTALRLELDGLRAQLRLRRVAMTDGLDGSDALEKIAAGRITEIIESRRLVRPAVIAVDHGGPSARSAEFRNEIATRIRARLGPQICRLAGASMEGTQYPHNHPLLAALLETPGFDTGDVVIAPLFLSPGRHAGPGGDIATICQTAEERKDAALRCHITELPGVHPLAVAALSEGLVEAVAARPG
jgi:CbiX